MLFTTRIRSACVSSSEDLVFRQDRICRDVSVGQFRCRAIMWAFFLATPGTDSAQRQVAAPLCEIPPRIKSESPDRIYLVL